MGLFDVNIFIDVKVVNSIGYYDIVDWDENFSGCDFVWVNLDFVV